jgi:hypothetical protein
MVFHPYSKDEETKTQRNKGSCPSSDRKEFELNLADGKAFALTPLFNVLNLWDSLPRDDTQ